MATAVFQGVSDDWNDAGNWVGGSGAGGVPANGDTVLIGDTAQDLKVGLSTGLTGMILRVGTGYTGSIGEAGVYLKMDGSEFVFDGRGPAGFFGGTWTSVQIVGGSGGSDMFQAAPDFATTTLSIYGGSGTATFPAGASIVNLESINATSITLDIQQGVTGLTSVVTDSGTIRIGSDVAGNVQARGGVLTFTDTAGITGQLRIEPDGVVSWESGGSIGDLEAFGNFDGTKNNFPSVVISTSAVYEQGRINVQNGLENFAFTNPTVTYGGVLSPPLGKSLQIV